ncbi:hypothetical protein VTJ04DRAFT_2045 [Mycothermus thermophilus]|uniref:uncharacterized protein n=1 Tax=Humicola insolens TaxID=85995 RepID=UPI00374219B3
MKATSTNEASPPPSTSPTSPASRAQERTITSTTTADRSGSAREPLSMNGHLLSCPHHFEAALRTESRNALDALLRLSKALLSPWPTISYKGGEDRLIHHCAVKEAQIALATAMTALLELVDKPGRLAASLRAVEHVFGRQRTGGSAGRRRLKRRIKAVGGDGFEILMVLVGLVLPGLGGGERTEIRRCLVVIQGLRLVRRKVAAGWLMEGALQKGDSVEELLTTLRGVEEWFMAAALHPFRAILPPSILDYSAVIDSGVGVLPTISRPKSDGVQGPEPRREEKGTVPKPPDISTLRWKVAKLVYQLRATLSPIHPPPTPLDNPISRPHPPPRRPILASPVPSIARPFISLLTSSLPPSLQPNLSLNLTHPLTAILNNNNHPRLSLLSLLNPSSSTPGLFVTPNQNPSTYRPALVNLTLAALITHILRTLLPPSVASLLFLPAGVAESPLEHIRLARTNPDVFVSEALGRRKQTTAGWWCAVAVTAMLFREVVRWAWEVLVGGWLAAKTVHGEDELTTSLPLAAVGWSCSSLVVGVEDDKRTYSRQQAWRRIVAVAYLVWVLIEMEYTFALSIDVSAWVLACYKLFIPGAAKSAEVAIAGRRAFWAAMSAAGPARVCTLAWRLADALGVRLWPVILASTRRARRGRPGMLVTILGVAGVVWMVLRYRSTFFIALEVSGMFVFLIYVGVGVVGLAAEFWREPLGLGESSEFVERIGARAEEVLQTA